MTSATSGDSLWRRLYYTRLRDVLRGRLDARLDWRHLVAAADLPEPLAAAVSQVVSKSRLWRSERAAVASELCAHFQDGLEAGVPADVLLESFGDPTAAAQLIRRAKRRNRPLTWHIWRYGWMAVLALSVLNVAIGLWMSLGRPTVKTDYLAAVNKVALAVSESERAWPVYRDALLAMGMQLDQMSAPEGNLPDNSARPSTAGAAFVKNKSKPGEPGWAEKEKFLNDNAGSIAKLREAARRSSLGFITTTSRSDFTEKDRELFGIELTPEEIAADKRKTLDDRWAMSAYLPNLMLLRNTGQLLADDVRRAAIAGDGDTAYDDVVAMLGVSRHAAETPFLVAIVVGELVQRQAIAAVRDVLADHPAVWSDDQLRNLAHKFAASRIKWQRGFEGETIAFNDSMQRLYTDDGNGDGRLAYRLPNGMNVFQMIESVVGTITDTNPKNSSLANPALAILAMPATNFVVASRKDMIETYEALTDHVPRRSKHLSGSNRRIARWIANSAR